MLIVAATGAALDGGAGQQQGVQRLRLGLDEVDDTLQGIDAPTGAKQTLLGNYGMLYRFALGLASPATAAIAPRGGGWGGVARVGATAVALPSATGAARDHHRRDRGRRDGRRRGKRQRRGQAPHRRRLEPSRRLLPRDALTP